MEIESGEKAIKALRAAGEAFVKAFCEIDTAAEQLQELSMFLTDLADAGTEGEVSGELTHISDTAHLLMDVDARGRMAGKEEIVAYLRGVAAEQEAEAEDNEDTEAKPDISPGREGQVIDEDSTGDIEHVIDLIEKTL